MNPRIFRLTIYFALLLILLAVEYRLSFLSMSRPLRPLLLIPAALMAAIVALNFMELRREPEPVHLFAVASLLWLVILLGLGSVDPITRIIYSTQTTTTTFFP
jgi:hypothetical protein